MEVHSHLGPGFLEPVYHEALSVELAERGVPAQREVEVPVFYKGQSLGIRYRADFICFSRVLVELKSLDRLTSREYQQVIHYLAASGLETGLLINFGASRLMFKRFVNSAGRLSHLRSSASSADHPSRNRNPTCP